MLISEVKNPDREGVTLSGKVAWQAGFELSVELPETLTPVKVAVLTQVTGPTRRVMPRRLGK